MKLSLQVKIIFIVLLPSIIIGAMSIWISDSGISRNKEQDMYNQLKTLAYAGREFYESLNNDSFSRDESGTVRKGDFVITENYLFVDNIYKSADIYASFFYQDERIVTNVLDYKGARMVGTKAAGAVVNEVLLNGNDYFSDNIIIGGEQYYGYYVPIYQPDTDEIIGMFFTGDSTAKIQQTVNDVKNTIALAIACVVIISIILTFFVVLNMTNTLKRTIKNLETLSNGVFAFEEKKHDTSRGDEIGDIVRATNKLKDALNTLIGRINETSKALSVSAVEMEGVIAETTQNTLEIYAALENLVTSTTQQVASIDSITDPAYRLNESISHITDCKEHFTARIHNIKEAMQILLENFSAVSANKDMPYHASEQFQVINENLTDISDDLASILPLITQMTFIRDTITALSTELSAISEENAASTKATSEATDHVADSMIEIENEIKALRELAVDLTHDLTSFRPEQ